jgi:hypothetical protein
VKRNQIIFYIISFTLLEGLCQYLIVTKMGIPFEFNKNLILPGCLFLSMLWFSLGLWEDTTESFLEYMNSDRMQIHMRNVSLLVWACVGYGMYKKFHTHHFYEGHKLAFIAIAYLNAISIDMWIKVAYTKILLSLYELRKENDK